MRALSAFGAPRRFHLAAAIGAFVAALSLTGCGEAPDADAVKSGITEWAHESSDLKADPAVTWGTLDNGMRYAVMKNETPSQSISLRFYVNAGSLNEAEDQRGAAHFLEHLAFKGSENIPGDELVKFLEREGLAFGPDTNAYTGFDQTVYQLELPEADDALLDKGFGVLREVADRLLLETEAIEKERGVILSERRVRNTPGFRKVKALYEFALKDTLLAERFPIGTQEVIETIPRSEFVEFYRSYYRPERTMVVAVGDADPAAIEAEIAEAFAGFTSKAPEDVTPPDLGEIENRGLAAGYFSDPDIPTTVTLMFVRPLEAKPDTIANRRLELLRALGNSILSRRFESLAQKEDAVFLDGGAGQVELFDFAQLHSVDLTAQPDTWREALGVAEQELRRAVEHGFTQAELEEQLARFGQAYRDAVKTADTRESSTLASMLIESVHTDRVFTHPIEALKQYQKAVSGLTVEDVNAVFQDEWVGREPLIFVAGKLDLENPEAEILKAYKESTQVPTPALEKTTGSAFAYTTFGEPGKVADRDEVEDLGITRIRFENNVYLNLKKTDFKADEIRVQIRLGGGLLEYPEDKPGIDFMADYILTAGGLEAHSFDEILRLFAGATVSADFGIGDDAFFMVGGTDSDDFLKQMQIMAAYLTAPGYRSEAMSRFKKEIDIVFETIDATPGGIVRKDVPRIIRNGDVRFGLPDRDALEALTADDLRAWLSPVFAQGHLEIGIVGDFDPETVIAAVAQTFGALPVRSASRAEYPKARELTFPEADDRVTLYHEGEPDQAKTMVFWPTTDSRNRRQSRVLRLAAAVLELRLTEEVRRKAGATYSPRVSASMSDVFPGYGYIAAELDLTPEDTERFEKQIAEIAADMAANGITEDEFERATKPQIEAAEEALERNGYWLGNVVGQAQSAPKELDHARSLLTDYRGIRQEEIETAIETFLVPEKAFRIVILPRKKNE